MRLKSITINNVVAAIATMILLIWALWGQAQAANDSLRIPLYWGDTQIDSVWLYTWENFVKDSTKHTSGSYWDSTFVFDEASDFDALFLIYYVNRTNPLSYHYSKQQPSFSTVTLADGSLTASKIAVNAFTVDKFAAGAIDASVFADDAVVKIWASTEADTAGIKTMLGNNDYMKSTDSVIISVASALASGLVSEIEDSVIVNAASYKADVSTIVTNIVELLADLDTLGIYSGWIEGAKSYTTYTNDSDVVQIWNGSDSLGRIVFYHLVDTTGGPPDSTVTE